MRDVLPFLILMKYVGDILIIQGYTPKTMLSCFEPPVKVYKDKQKEITLTVALQYTRDPSIPRGSSLAVNDRTLDVRVTSDRPNTP